MTTEELQRRLRQFVSRSLEITGEQDDATEAALVQFQRRFGIAEVGFEGGGLNEETLISLRAMDQDMEPGWLD